MSKEEKKRKEFEEFLSTNNVLIVDQSGSSRRRLIKTLVDMGGKSHQISAVASFHECKEILEEKKPQLILSDYKVKGGSGFDLFSFIRHTYPEEKKMTLILVTANISQTAVAKAAEEDVDSFIIKPYTVKSLEQSLINAVLLKINPSEYIKKVNLAKDMIEAGKVEESIDILEEAKTLDPKPSLAMFYLGQAQYMLKILEQAKEKYNEGLKINSIHFKCQVGLYTIFKNEEQWDNAYKVVRNIAKYFPSNPDRLKEVVHLCVRTENYKDLEEYYGHFLELEERPDQVVDYICAGMYILGKWFFMNSDNTRGKEIYEKIVVSCAGNPKYLKAVITVLSQNNEHSVGQRYLSRFTGDSTSGNEYLAAACYSEWSTMDANQKVKSILEVYNAGVKEHYTFELIVEAFKEADMEQKLEEYVFEAKKLYPNQPLKNLEMNSDNSDESSQEAA
ncbi:response regulator [Bacteriovoracaceae bacterium]|nr:response regulator [Bacteriovoracaceae bacterium]